MSLFLILSVFGIQGCGLVGKGEKASTEECAQFATWFIDRFVEGNDSLGESTPEESDKIETLHAKIIEKCLKDNTPEEIACAVKLDSIQRLPECSQK